MSSALFLILSFSCTVILILYKVWGYGGMTEWVYDLPTGPDSLCVYSAHWITAAGVPIIAPHRSPLPGNPHTLTNLTPSHPHRLCRWCTWCGDKPTLTYSYWIGRDQENNRPIRSQNSRLKKGVWSASGGRTLLLTNLTRFRRVVVDSAQSPPS